MSACGSQAGGATRPSSDRGGRGEEVDLDPSAIAKARARAGSGSSRSSGGGRPHVVVAVPPGMASEDQSLQPSRRSQVNRAKEDAQIRKDLAEFRAVVATVVQAANEIAKTPYRWGGGHGLWRDKGYDCSGSVSFALAADDAPDHRLHPAPPARPLAPGARWLSCDSPWPGFGTSRFRPSATSRWRSYRSSCWR